MDWIQVLSLFLANAGLIIWFRAESRSDWRHMDMKLETFKEEMRTDMKQFRDDMKQFRELWMQESKEFHQRLCDIEAKRK